MKSLSRSLFFVGFALLIFGSKLWLVDFAGSDLPVSDQWDGVGEKVLRPWVEGRLTFNDIVSPHNEHRLITTKLYVLGLFIANGQWDVLVETTASAAIHTFCAVLLLLLASRWLKGGWWLAFAILVLLLFSLPFGWENTLGGFQVQFYFLLLFSGGHIFLTLESDRFTWRWAGGQLAAVLALISMASGFFSAIAVVAAMLQQWRHTRRLTAQQAITVGFCLILVALGCWLKTEVPAHDALKSQSFGQFMHRVLLLLAWPGSDFFPWSLVLFAPAVLFLIRCVRQRETSTDDSVLLGLFGWVVLQCFATAYARGNASPLSSRYLDLLAIGIALGFVFVVRELSGRTRQVAASFWFIAIALGLLQQSDQMWKGAIVPDVAQHRRQEDNVRAFLASNDATLLRRSPAADVPYPSVDVLIQRLSPPAIRQILPPSVRRPVPVIVGAPPAPWAMPPNFQSAPYPIAVSTWTLPPNDKTFLWRSGKQSAGILPVLRFRVAGDLGANRPALKLVIKSASSETTVSAESLVPGRWKNVNIFRPDGEWWIEATDADHTGWFAFTEPVEVGRWSWFASKLLKSHFAVTIAGSCLLIAGLASFAWRRTAS